MVDKQYPAGHRGHQVLQCFVQVNARVHPVIGYFMYRDALLGEWPVNLDDKVLVLRKCNSAIFYQRSANAEYCLVGRVDARRFEIECQEFDFIHLVAFMRQRFSQVLSQWCVSSSFRERQEEALPLFFRRAKQVSKRKYHRRLSE